MHAIMEWSYQIKQKKQSKEKTRDERLFAFFFPIDKLDSLRIWQIIIFDLKSQKSNASLADKISGILEQNRFLFDLELAILQMNVHLIIKKNMQELQSLEISKVVFFDGLTKDTFFNTINIARNPIEIARIKTGQLRDSVLSSNVSRTCDNNDLK